MPMTITRLDDARVFLERAGTFLTEHEAENNLLFGISHTLIHAPVFYPEHYLALVHDESQHDSQHENQPTVAALMTPPHNLILSYVPDAEALGGALDQALDLLARDIYESYPALPGVIAQTGVAERFARRWRDLTGQAYEIRLRERIFRLSVVQPLAAPSGALVRASIDDRDLLVEWALAFTKEALGDDDRAQAEPMVDERLTTADPTARGLYLWVDGAPVAMAGYTGPTPHGIRVGPVYTPKTFRGKGYASALVAQMSQALLDGGRTYCFLFTNLANPTSNHIYQEIGYEPVGDADVYAFNDNV